MVDTSKVRIYDLARSMVPDDLSDRDKKSLQAAKTKQILTVCERLGYNNKTASSSIDAKIVSEVLLSLNTSPSELLTSSPKTKQVAQRVTTPVEPPKRTRVLRRIARVEEELEQPEEQIIEEAISESTLEEVLEIATTTIEEDALKKDDDVVEEIPLATNEQPPELITPPAQANIEEPNLKPALKPTFRFGQIQQGVPTTPPSATKIAPPTPQPQADAARGAQPFRIARPINTPFANTRRKTSPGRRDKPVGARPNPPSSPGRSLGVKNKPPVADARPTTLNIEHSLTVKEFADKLLIQDTEVIRSLFMKGILRTVNQNLEFDLMKQLAEEFGCELKIQAAADEDDGLTSKLKDLVSGHDDRKDLMARPPVVTIMGHVDHGKTTLLDAIRKAKHDITAQESGGITQHIGAYQVVVTDYDDKQRIITFLDTPGHEAFTALRARGAQVTDIAVLVVSADDGVMPQTIEAISHAKAANVPIVVAVNKIDKPDANPDRVLGQLTEHGLVVEDFGGTVVCAKISAKQQLNLDDLLTKITLVADAELGNKLLASASAAAVGAVIESSLSPSRGTVATLLIQSGTLRRGDAIAAGASCGRVRAIFDDFGREISEAPPSTPALVLGLDSQPRAGDTFKVFPNYSQAKQSANLARESIATQRRGSRGLEYFSTQVREGSAKELPIIIKADVQGSAEALSSELLKLSTEEVSVKIVHCAAGSINESDVNLATTTGSILVNFSSTLDQSLLKQAQENGVAVYDYDIIYKVTDAVQKAILGLLEPETIEVKYGSAEVRKIFPFDKIQIAGCAVIEGKVVANSTARVFRNRKEIVRTPIEGLKRFKDDAREVLQGFECGITLEKFSSFEEGDIIESWGQELQVRSS